jgi:hypothetical protein
MFIFAHAGPCVRARGPMRVLSHPCNQIGYSFSLSSVALPPAAAVLTVTVCSVVKRLR